ncbi:MAG TPA: hypothetical protein PLS69_03445 [Terricaulis sp.]|nr:hypothetical protein [Terricaulis sp.]
MKAEELRARAFLALYQKSMSDGIRYYSLLDETRLSGTPIPYGLDWMIAQKLRANGWVDIYQAEEHDDERAGYVVITWDGIEAAERLLEERAGSLSGETAPWVPAAGRYVTLNDNQRDGIERGIADLKQVVRGANELEELEREIALSEIAIFEAALVGPWLSRDLIERFVNGVLSWVGKTIVNAAASEVVRRLYSGLSVLA